MTLTAPRAAVRIPAQRRGSQAPAAPLGSLTQRENRTVESCRSCGSPRLTRLAMQLTDGTPVAFTSCHDCQHRSWAGAEGDLALGAVLEHARKR